MANKNKTEGVWWKRIRRYKQLSGLDLVQNSIFNLHIIFHTSALKFECLDEPHGVKEQDLLCHLYK